MSSANIITKFFDHTMKRLSVIKFGGTSVVNFEAMSRCADTVTKTQGIKVIVISALATITRSLISLSKQSISAENKKIIIQEITDRHYQILNSFKNANKIKNKLNNLLKRATDLADILSTQKDLKLTAELLALGEQMSSLLFTALLNKRNISAVNFDVRKVLKTNSDFLNAKPNITEIEKCCEQYLIPLCKKQTIVTQGFIGSDANGDTTILGMESSDYTAALLAEAIQADHFEIWTDVPGVFTADPKIATHAHPIPELSFQEAMELTKFGAKVLHPATLQPALRKNIKFCVACNHNPQQKTWIYDKKNNDIANLCAISLKKDQTLLTIKNNTHTNFSASISNIFTKYNINPDLVTNSNSSTSVIIDDSQQELTQESLLTKNLVNELTDIGQIEIQKQLAIIALIGNNIYKHQLINNVLFDFLKANNIRLIFHGSSSHSICFLVNNSIAENLVNELHDKLFRGHT
jgi:aspartate kinase